MATAVLHAQDCFLSSSQKNRHEGFMGVVYRFPAKSKSKSPQRENKKPGQGHGHGHGSGSSPRKAKVQQEKKRPLKPRAQDKAEEEGLNETGKKFVKSQNYHRHDGKQAVGNKLLTGQVIILKRGQTVEGSSHMLGRLGVSPAKTAAAAVQISRSVEISVKKSNSKSKSPVVRMAEEWAGPAFVNSPSPRCLPLPKFPVKKTESTVEKKVGEELAKIESYATRDLRRLLGLV